MPNWVSIRLTLSGPHAEIMRLQNTCVRATPEEASDEQSFDLGALVPMPAAIVATLDDHSAAAKQAAFNATGFEDWYEWRINHWGCKWNTSNLHVITATADLLDVSFETPWSVPEPALAALAAQFPLLSGRVCAIEEGMDWGLIGEFQAGSYTSTFVEAAAELRYLVDGWRLNGHLRQNSGRILAEPSGDMQESDDDVLARIWAELGAKLAPGLMARMRFEFDVERFVAWHNVDHDLRGGNREGCLLQDVIQTPLNLEFLSGEGRCYHPLDRKLVVVLAEGLTAEWGQPPDAAQIDSDLHREVACLLFEYDEGELSEWAFHAIVRQQSGINFTDLASLQESFFRYAKGMREQILQHLESVQEAMMVRRFGHVACGRAPDPLSSCVTLS
jgi:hypothetical protein